MHRCGGREGPLLRKYIHVCHDFLLIIMLRFIIRSDYFERDCRIDQFITKTTNHKMSWLKKLNTAEDRRYKDDLCWWLLTPYSSRQDMQKDTEFNKNSRFLLLSFFPLSPVFFIETFLPGSFIISQTKSIIKEKLIWWGKYLAIRLFAAKKYEDLRNNYRIFCLNCHKMKTI